MKQQKVFGIGWAKTGTTTLGSCLEVLGYRHQGPALDLVYDVAAGRFDRVYEVVDRHDVFEDWPWILIYQQLDARYPGSRFILTTRNTDSWWRSYRNMIVTKDARPDIGAIREVIYGVADGLKNKQAYIDRYERHNAEVRRYFARRPDDLLVLNWEDGDGWPALCQFLDRQIPDQPIPRANAGLYRPWYAKAYHSLLKNRATKRRVRAAT